MSKGIIKYYYYLTSDEGELANLAKQWQSQGIVNDTAVHNC